MPESITIPVLVTSREVAAMLGVPDASTYQRSALMRRLGVTGARVIGAEKQYDRAAVVAAIHAMLQPPKETARVAPQRIVNVRLAAIARGLDRADGGRSPRA